MSDPVPATPKPTAAPAPVAASAAAATPPPPPPPNPLAHLATPFKGVDFALKGWHAEATVSPDKVVIAARELDKEGFALDAVTGVDWPAPKKAAPAAAAAPTAVAGAVPAAVATVAPPPAPPSAPEPQGEMEVIYDFFHPIRNTRAVVRARIPRENPEIPTISAVFPGANWHERETHDFFGIRFLGHPNLTPFLLPEDADYHPLRKDFSL